MRYLRFSSLVGRYWRKKSSLKGELSVLQPTSRDISSTMYITNSKLQTDSERDLRPLQRISEIFAAPLFGRKILRVKVPSERRTCVPYKRTSRNISSIMYIAISNIKADSEGDWREASLISEIFLPLHVNGEKIEDIK